MTTPSDLPESDFEQQLKALARRELSEDPAAMPEIIDSTVKTAQKELALKETLGVFAAFFWVVFAGLGLSLYRSVHQYRSRNSALIRRKPSSKPFNHPTKPTINGGRL